MLDFSSMFLDVLVDGVLFFSKVEYLMGSPANGSNPYKLVNAPATHNISFRYSNHPELGVIASTQLQVQPGTYHTIVIFGRNTTAFPIQTASLVDWAPIVRGGERSMEDKGNGNAKSMAAIRYFNAGISFSATTVQVNGKDLFISTPYGKPWKEGHYVEIDAASAKDGVFDFVVVDARYEEIPITFDRLQLTNGCAFTLFSTGVLGNYYSPLMIVDTKDWCI